MRSVPGRGTAQAASYGLHGRSPRRGRPSDTAALPEPAADLAMLARPPAARVGRAHEPNPHPNRVIVTVTVTRTRTRIRTRTRTRTRTLARWGDLSPLALPGVDDCARTSTPEYVTPITGKGETREAQRAERASITAKRKWTSEAPRPLAEAACEREGERDVRRCVDGP